MDALADEPIPGARRPVRAAEREPVAFDHAAPRRGALLTRADETKSRLLEHAPRGRILDPHAGVDRDGMGQGERRLHHRRDRLARVALAPEFGRQDVPERQPVAAAKLQADGADRLSLTADRRQHERQVAARAVALARRVDEALGGAGRIGMGNARGVARDLPAAAITLYRESV